MGKNCSFVLVGFVAVVDDDDDDEEDVALEYDLDIIQS